MSADTAAATAAVPELGEGFEPPRSNGDPQFDEPWHSRIFGMVVSVHQQGLFPWDDFKTRLIEEIQKAGEVETEDPSVYYTQFAAAFNRLLTETDVLTSEQIEERTAVERHKSEHAHDGADHHHD